MPDNTPATHVTVLMAVYKGEAYLQAQLDSIVAQQHPDWHILISDDSPTSDSRAIAEAFAVKTGRTTVLTGPGQGGTTNFMSLIRAVSDHTEQDTCIAFSDQDDVWLPKKLTRALAQLAPHGDIPTLYCSRSYITDETLSTRRLSAPRPRAPSFENALVQNIASGNTIVLNLAASDLIRRAAAESPEPVVHDWWVYQLITGAGGVVVHDDMPTLLYRQHGVNQIGANDTTRARLKRIGMLLRGDFKQWNETNIAVLHALEAYLTPENRAALKAFDTLRQHGLAKRLMALYKLGLYRQSHISTAALWVSAVLGKL
ncbi:MAG: glycosyltransferase [Roseovarius sp.]